MNARFTTFCTLGFAMVTALAGIFEVIDETSMVVLVIVLMGWASSRNRACLAKRSA